MATPVKTLPISVGETSLDSMDRISVVPVDPRMAIKPPKYNIHSLTAYPKMNRLTIPVTHSVK